MRSSVIICAYTFDRWSALSEAVASCFNQSSLPDEVIVVIDYNEELRERASEEFTKAKVIANEMTKGLSGARNTGVLASQGEILIFLDDDAYADERWLERLVDTFDDPAIAGCGGWIVPHWEGGEPRWFPRTFLWIMGCSYQGLPPHGAAIRNPIGANMALRRDVFELVGGFSAGLGRIGTTPLGCEETELCIRYGVRRPQDSFVLVRDAVVHHRVPPSRCTWKYFFSRCWSEGLSKAAVASLVGHDHGLSAERRHVAQALPREIVESLRDVTHHPGAVLRRIVSVVAGSLVAAAGFLRGARAVRRNPISLKSADLPGMNEPSTATHGHEWRPISIVSLDIDNLPGALTLSDDVNDRVWLEATREGQVVGRAEVRATQRVVPHDDLVEVAQRFAGRESTYVAVADADLAPISIIVPTICRFPQELAAFAKRMDELDYPTYEVIVVDNRVSPTYDMPDLSGLSHVIVVAERIPGISAARNRGLAVASYDIVAFTDDDVIVDPRWLRALAGRFAKNPEITALGGLVLPAELATAPQLWFEEYFGGFSQSLDLQIASLTDHRNDPLFPYAPGRYAAGCNMAFLRPALQALGGFRLTLGTGTPAFGGEDLEMFTTLASGGATIAFEPAAVVRHIHRSTEEQFLAQTRGYGAGLTAMHTALVVHRPRHLLTMGALAWRGFRSLRTSREQRSVSTRSSYPPQTSRIERRGMLFGPLAYIRSEAKFRRMRRRVVTEFGETVRI